MKLCFVIILEVTRERPGYKQKQRQNDTVFIGKKRRLLNSEFCVLACIGKVLEQSFPFVLTYASQCLVAKQNQNFSEALLLWRDWGRVTVALTELLFDLPSLFCMYWPAFFIDSLFLQINQFLLKGRERLISSRDVYCRVGWPSLTKIIDFACVLI